MELQSKYEKVQGEMIKAKNRHAYYKDLMQELSDIPEVKKKLNMSVSDVGKDEDNEYGNHNKKENKGKKG